MSDIIVRTQGTLGRITLNRPRAINALTLGMIREIDAALDAFASDSAINAVLMDGAGDRGLCAGGDIRALYEAAIAGETTVAEIFFREEFRLNAKIARFPKPYVAFMDGIVMGGGIGVSAHGSVRIVTQRSRLAMPETGIGYMPDVGGTYLLSRAPHGYGIHLALTAAPAGAAFAIAAGLADVFVPASDLPDLADALATCTSAADLQACVQRAARPAAPGIAAGATQWMEQCYAGPDVETILATLRATNVPEALSAAETIAAKSPTSLKVTLRALRQAQSLPTLEACLEQEYRLSMVFMRSHDFREGVRAAVVDKDRNPKWQPATLAAVGAGIVDGFFEGGREEGLLF